MGTVGVAGGATPDWPGAVAARGSACASGRVFLAAPVARSPGRARGSGAERRAGALFLTEPMFGMEAGGTGGYK